MDVLAAVFALQVQQLHHHFVGVAVVDFALQEDDAVLQQQIAQRQLPLPLVAGRGIRIGKRSSMGLNMIAHGLAERWSIFESTQGIKWAGRVQLALLVSCSANEGGCNPSVGKVVPQPQTPDMHRLSAPISSKIGYPQLVQRGEIGYLSKAETDYSTLVFFGKLQCTRCGRFVVVFGLWDIGVIASDGKVDIR